MADVRQIPVSNYPAYYGAGLISKINEAVSKPFGYENDPIRALTNLLGVPAFAKTLENMAYGMPNVTGSGMATQLRPEAKETVGALLPMAPGAAKLATRGAVAGGKYIAPTVGGLLDDYATKTGLQMYAYRPTTPKKPDPSVGTRFEKEYIGGLADKTPVKIEDYKDASLMIMPWDSSSRNFRIKSVSDILLPRQYVTHGGQDYARDINHMADEIAGASNFGIANRIVGRDDIARAENLSAGGSGNVIHMPSTMGEFGENFSVQPVSLLLGIADSGKLSKANIKAFDQSVKEFKVPKKVGDKDRKSVV
jgi:hypothetical protein